jgi:hypothetical protein
MAGAGWLAKAEAPAAGSHLAAKVAKPEEAPLVDMIAPELVFTKDKDE